MARVPDTNDSGPTRPVVRPVPIIVITTLVGPIIAAMLALVAASILNASPGTLLSGAYVVHPAVFVFLFLIGGGPAFATGMIVGLVQHYRGTATWGFAGLVGFLVVSLCVSLFALNLAVGVPRDLIVLSILWFVSSAVSFQIADYWCRRFPPEP